MYSYRKVIHQGKVSVYSDQIIAISFVDASDQLKKFGMEVSDAGGTVTLHLATGGEIHIDSKDPVEEAALWLRLTEMDQ